MSVARRTPAAGSVALAVLGLAAALWLGWMALERNLQQACQLKQWPPLASCEATATQPVARQVQELRQQVRTNPGDSRPLTALATLSQRPGGAPGLDGQAVLEAASQLAPHQRQVLRLRANQALKQGQWSAAVDQLIQLAQFHGDGEAALTLARMVGQAGQSPELLAALMRRLQPDGRWLERVLHTLPAAKVPVVQAMPLVQAAMPLGLITPALGQMLMQHLMAGGAWLDAHAVWLHLWNRPLGLLFNGDFEQDFVPQGFDWQVTDANLYRAGARVQQPRMGPRGRVLEVAFTGRPITQPVLSQPLVLPPGDYLFSAEYMSRGFRSQDGLAWVFICASNRQELTRTVALKDTSGRWEKIATPLHVPNACGVGVRLVLQTFAGYEAATGLRGEMRFDRFELRSSERHP